MKSLCTFGVLHGVRRCCRFYAKTAGTATSNAQFVVSEDGVAEPSSLTPKEFLLSRPTGAYTTARTTCAGQRLFEWDTHVHRTAASAAEMLRQSGHPEANRLIEELGSTTSLRPRLDATVATAVRKYLSIHGDKNELKVTVLVTWADSLTNEVGAEIHSPGTVIAHVSPLPPIPSPPVKVEVRGAPRANAAAKDSSWVSERSSLEAVMRADMNELLLASPEGEIFEGSQTNFYAVIDGSVHTAGGGVLEGTVRRLVLHVCEREGIPVVLSPPQLATIDTWEGALISSTSRLLLPVHQIYHPTTENQTSTDADLIRSFEYESTPASRLSDWVRDLVETHSVEITDLSNNNDMKRAY